jgi:hypothetical protein
MLQGLSPVGKPPGSVFCPYLALNFPGAKRGIGADLASYTKSIRQLSGEAGRKDFFSAGMDVIGQPNELDGLLFLVVHKEGASWILISWLSHTARVDEIEPVLSNREPGRRNDGETVLVAGKSDLDMGMSEEEDADSRLDLFHPPGVLHDVEM